MNKRLKEFYKMRNRLPKDARQWVKQDSGFLNSLDEYDFEYLLDWEYNNAMERYQTVRTDALNPRRAGSFNPERPKNDEGDIMSGSSEFDSFESTHGIKTQTDADLIYRIWINTGSHQDTNEKEFLKEIDRNWDLGNFNTPYSEFIENIDTFLKKVTKMDYDRLRYETVKR